VHLVQSCWLSNLTLHLDCVLIAVFIAVFAITGSIRSVSFLFIDAMLVRSRRLSDAPTILALSNVAVLLVLLLLLLTELIALCPPPLGFRRCLGANENVYEAATLLHLHYHCWHEIGIGGWKRLYQCYE
jgi:hypothetical protein